MQSDIKPLQSEPKISFRKISKRNYGQETSS